MKSVLWGFTHMYLESFKSFFKEVQEETAATRYLAIFCLLYYFIFIFHFTLHVFFQASNDLTSDI